MPAPVARYKILPARGNLAALTAAIADIAEGEIAYAIDQDLYYQKQGGVLEPVGVPEAPQDGTQYVRNNAAWEAVDVPPGTVVSDTPPESPDQGQQWYDTGTARLFLWTGSEWVDASPDAEAASFLVSETAPENANEGDGWFNESNGKTYVYVDGVWVQSTHTDMALLDGSVTPAKLSTGGPSWDASGNTTFAGNITGGAYDQSSDTTAGYEFTQSGVLKVQRTAADAQNSANQVFRVFGGDTQNVSISADGSAYFASNVGIGTASPSDYGANLAVANTSGNSIISVAASTSGVSGINFADGTASAAARAAGFIQHQHSNNSLNFGIADDIKITLDSSGRLLLGTSSASSSTAAIFQGNSANADGGGTIRLQRNDTTPSVDDTLGLITFGTPSNTGFNAAAWIAADRDSGTWTNDSSQPGRLVFATTASGASSPTERMRIASDGRTTFQGLAELSGSTSYLKGQEGYIDFRSTTYGVAIRSALRNILIYTTNVAGVVLNNGATSFSPFTSESRLKNIIGDVDSDQAWDLVRDIELKRFQYKDGEDQLVPYAGPMADWLGQQDPELLIDTGRSDDDGPIHTYNQGLLDTKALAALSAALKRIEALETQNSDLEARLSALEQA